ncbi:MAG: TIGR00725 family protein [Chloroflexi bacterium]|nr:TIGR00725 family protein [Chloroflexota bacterium]
MKEQHPSRPLMLAVIGGSSASEDVLLLAYEVGQEVARRGGILVCGGLTGVMEAACRGAQEAGGLTVGILPGNDPAEANRYVDIPICTGIGYARNAMVVKAGRAVIAIDGAYGTLSEIGHALAENIPVIGLATWSFSVDGRQDHGIIPARDAADAVDKALEAVRRRGTQAQQPEQVG